MELSKLEQLSLSPVMTNELREMANVEAVLLVHDELPKGENGAAAITIRMLLDMQKVSCEPMLTGYICAFGAYGLPVIRRTVARIAEKSSDSDVLTKLYSEYVQEKYASLRESVDKQLSAM